MKWLRDDTLKLCVPKSSNDGIIDWCALGGLESGVVPFSLMIALGAGNAAEFDNNLR